MLRSAVPQPFFTGISRAIVNVFFERYPPYKAFTKTKPGTNLFNGGTTRLLLSLDAACINKGKESYSTSMDPSV